MEKTYTRASINNIVPGRLYQRGQILTWQRAYKLQLIEYLKVGVVVNLWPKLDPDMSDMPCYYLYLPSSSQDTVGEDIMIMSKCVAELLNNSIVDKSALILCEAGKTRSVFFAGLVLMHMYTMTGAKALKILEKRVPGHRMKPYMIDWFNSQ